MALFIAEYKVCCAKPVNILLFTNKEPLIVNLFYWAIPLNFAALPSVSKYFGSLKNFLPRARPARSQPDNRPAVLHLFPKAIA